MSNCLCRLQSRFRYTSSSLPNSQFFQNKQSACCTPKAQSRGIHTMTHTHTHTPRKLHTQNYRTHIHTRSHSHIYTPIENINRARRRTPRQERMRASGSPVRPRLDKVRSAVTGTNWKFNSASAYAAARQYTHMQTNTHANTHTQTHTHLV